MRLRRKIVTAGLSVVSAIALAACGQQVVAHVKAGDSVHAGLTSVWNGPTTRFVVTAEGLPGEAALADGSFSVVITTEKDASGTLTGMELSVLHQTTDLADILAVSSSTYLRVDLKDIISLSGNPSEFATISSAVAKAAALPNLGYLNDIVAGKWVGVTSITYQGLMTKYMKSLTGTGSSSGLPASASSAMPSYLKNLEKLLKNPQKLKELRLTVRTSFFDSLHTWLSIHQKAAGEYSMTLPLRSFLTSLLSKLLKPLESYLGGPTMLPQAEITQAMASIPAGLSLQANLWISNGSLTKIQAFIPQSSAYLMIGVSHPTAALVAPSGATMLTATEITALKELSALTEGLIGGSLGSSASTGGLSAISGISSAL